VLIPLQDGLGGALRLGVGHQHVKALHCFDGRRRARSQHLESGDGALDIDKSNARTARLQPVEEASAPFFGIDLLNLKHNPGGHSSAVQFDEIASPNDILLIVVGAA